MAQAPPTPPPTTDAELMDEVRFAAGQQPVADTSTSSSAAQQSNAPSAPSAPSQAPTDQPTVAPQAAAVPPVPAVARPDIYAQAFPVIKDLATAGNIENLIQVAEQADRQGYDENSTSHLLVIGPLVLGYLNQDLIPAARHALTSLPRATLTVPLTRTLLGLVASVYDRKHANVYTRAQDIKTLVSKSDFFNAELGTVLQILVDQFITVFRSRTVEFLSRAFTSIPLSVASRYIGLPHDQVLSGAKQSGWSYDASTQLLYPKSRTTVKDGRKGPSSSLKAFDFIADSVVQLEV